MNLCLTSEEVEELTDRVQPKLQIAWLLNPPIGEPWVFTIGASGRPKVDQEYYRHRMGMKDKLKPRKRVRTEGLAVNETP